MAYVDLSLEDRVRVIFRNLLLIQTACDDDDGADRKGVLAAISAAADAAADLLAPLRLVPSLIANWSYGPVAPPALPDSLIHRAVEPTRPEFPVIRSRRYRPAKRRPSTRARRAQRAGGAR